MEFDFRGQWAKRPFQYCEDVYGDTAETRKDAYMPFGNIEEIIEGCLDDFQLFIDEVIPKEESESGTDFSEDNYIEQISE